MIRGESSGMYEPHPLFILPKTKMNQVCKECGCSCSSCSVNNSLDLHQEIVELKAKLLQSNNRLLQMEENSIEAQEFTGIECSKLQEELVKHRDRYDRLYECYKKAQRLNHSLEDKLLSVVSKFEAEKNELQKEIATACTRLLDAKVTICDLEEECERYSSDCNLAVQLLQCKPSNFVAHKLNTLPVDLQVRVKGHLSKQELYELEDSEQLEQKRMIRVPMPTFPPTAMVYSVNRIPQHTERPSKPDTVPVTLIAKVLTQPELPRRPRRIYICNKCKSDIMFVDKQIQTCAIYPDSNGCHYPGSVSGYRTKNHAPGVHKPRNNSTETEI